MFARNQQVFGHADFTFLTVSLRNHWCSFRLFSDATLSSFFHTLAGRSILDVYRDWQIHRHFFDYDHGTKNKFICWKSYSKMIYFKARIIHEKSKPIKLLLYVRLFAEKQNKRTVKYIQPTQWLHSTHRYLFLFSRSRSYRLKFCGDTLQLQRPVGRPRDGCCL